MGEGRKATKPKASEVEGVDRLKGPYLYGGGGGGNGRGP